MKTTLFLGAGASAFAGCPTTKKLRDLTLGNIRKKLGDPIDGAESIRLRFIEHIVQDTRLDDIEKVYSCADHILTAHNTYSGVVLDAMTYSGGGIGMNLPDMLNALRTLKRVIHETVLNSFTVDGGQKNDIEKMYGSLIDVVGSASGSVDIITTNYDNVIETYCNHTDTRWVDGFVPSRNGDHRVWKDSWDMEDGCVRLVKLHGSAAWQRDGDSIIEMQRPGLRGDDDDVLIAPTLGAKDYRREPFPQLFKQCDDILSRTKALIVIGYSFRDDGINKRFVDAMGRGATMFVVSPSAEEDVRLNLKPPAKFTKGIRSKIETIPEGFGRDEIAGLCESVRDILDGD